MLQPWVLRQQYQLDTFVETGCYEGASLTQAHWAGFEKLISCDISRAAVDTCRAAFPHAAILHCTSTTMLGPCLPALQKVMGHALFWLDAHFPSFYGLEETPATYYPLPEELRLIRSGKRDWEHDVIAIDDLRVIRDRNNPRFRPGELHGPEERLYQDITIAGICAPFAATHECKLLHAEEGVLLLLPRGA